MIALQTSGRSFLQIGLDLIILQTDSIDGFALVDRMSVGPQFKMIKRLLPFGTDNHEGGGNGFLVGFDCQQSQIQRLSEKSGIPRVRIVERFDTGRSFFRENPVNDFWKVFAKSFPLQLQIRFLIRL